MTMLKTFDLKGNKQSFANWISNLSPTETPFISMIPKEKVDQTQYSWQTDRLVQAGKKAADVAGTGADTGLDAFQEGSAFAAEQRLQTKVHTNFTQIFRKAVRVTDTTKKVSLYGRSSELAHQMEKAGLEIKRDLEYALLNSTEAGRPGTAAQHGVAEGILGLVATQGAKDGDTGAVVHKVVNYAADALPFTKAQVFDLTYNLYLVGSRANKIMFHPAHMALFSDWIGDTVGKAPKRPHVHRMFDGVDDKYNAFVKQIRDPLGQVFTLIPNRHMPKNKLFFFNESDWTQMVLREPEKVLLAKVGSSEKHMIEMEVGLRHRNPFASGILTFIKDNTYILKDARVTPSVKVTDGAEVESAVTVKVEKHDGSTGSSVTEGVTFTGVTVNDDGSTDAATVTADGTTTNGVAKAKVKHTKASRVKVTAKITDSNNADPTAGEAVTHFDVVEARP